MNKHDFELNLPEENRRVRWAVYAKIVAFPVLLYVFFVANYYASFGLSLSLNALALMGVILLVALIFARHNAEFGCLVFEQQKLEFKRDLKEFILKTLLSIGKDTKSNASFDDFMENYSRFVRNDSFANIATSVFALLGILGTFICLALNLPELSNMKFENFEFEISKLLSALGTAFYVCIYGLLLCLWWMFFERFGITRFNRIINRHKLATKGFFWSKEEIQSKYLQAGIASFSQISTIFNYVSNQEFFSELDSLVERKFTNFTSMLKTEEQAVRLSSEHIKQTMATLLKTQKDQKDIVRVHSDILNALYTFNQNLKDMQLNFAENYARLHNISDERISRLERAIGAFGDNLDKIEGKLEIFSGEILEKQKLALDGFKAGMIEGMQAFKSTFDSENISTDDGLAMINKIRNEIESIDNEANEALNSLEMLKEHSKNDDITQISSEENTDENK